MVVAGPAAQCLADASVKVLNKNISSPTWWAACTPNGKDLPGPEW